MYAHAIRHMMVTIIPALTKMDTVFAMMTQTHQTSAKTMRATNTTMMKTTMKMRIITRIITIATAKMRTKEIM